MTARDDKALRHPDPAALARRYDAAAQDFGDHAFVHARARHELLSRLDLLAVSPAALLDLGAGTGLGGDALAKRYPRATILELDRNTAMLAAQRRRRWFRAPARSRRHRVRADAAALPLPDKSMGLVFSNLLLPVCREPDRVLGEVQRVLKPGAPFVFSSLGPDTLGELRRAWAAVDDGAHVADFADMHDVGDALTRAGFAEPVLDVDKLSITYASPDGLWRDLTASGARNALPGRQAALTGKNRFRAMCDSLRRDTRGDQLTVTVEIVYAQCWGTEARAPSQPGVFHIDPGNIGHRGRR